MVPNPGDKGDSEYNGTGKQKKGGRGNRGRAKTAKAAPPTVQHTSGATRPPVASVPSMPNSRLLAPASATTTAFNPPALLPHPYFTPNTFNQANQSVGPTYPSAYPSLYAQSPIGGIAPIGLAIPSSPSVPMGIWSDSSSPHGQLLHATFGQSSSPAPNSVALNRQVPQPIPSPTPVGSNYEFPVMESDEGDDEDDDDTPFSPTAQAPPPASCTSATTASIGSQDQSPRRALGEATNTTLTADEDDVLESLRNKTKRRRRPHSRLANSLSATPNGAHLEKIDADPTNLNAYNNQERPFLHLVRVVYGAMLVTREAMPSPGTTRNFQVEAYEEAGRLLKTGMPATLPSRPNNLILRLIAKHGSASRGHIKTAALNAVISEYSIWEGRAEPMVIANRVANLLDRKNFTFREVTSEGCAGIFRHPAIAIVLVNTLFRDRDSEGVLAKHLFLPVIPEAAIFMACTAIEHALEMWSTGVRLSKDFSNDYTHRLLWNRHKPTWHDYIQRKGEQGEQGEQYARETRELITAQIRLVLDGLSPASAPATASSEGDSFFDENDAD